MRRLVLVLACLFAIALLLVFMMYRWSMADPVVRRAAVSLPKWPAGSAPVTIALVSDIHIGNLSTDGARVARIADQVTAARPDLIVLAGDFIAGHEPEDRAYAPALVPGLRRLRAPLGVVAVLGNHDHWISNTDVRAALERAGVTVLSNAAVRRGPLAIGGIDDLVTRHANLSAVRRAMTASGGAPVLVSHSPDVAPWLQAGLVLAGHTHCGQVWVPGYRHPPIITRYGTRYLCGVVREGRRTTIITAGVGTSSLPVRLGVPPDIWLIRVGP